MQELNTKSIQHRPQDFGSITVSNSIRTRYKARKHPYFEMDHQQSSESLFEDQNRKINGVIGKQAHMRRNKNFSSSETRLRD